MGCFENFGYMQLDLEDQVIYPTFETSINNILDDWLSFIKSALYLLFANIPPTFAAALITASNLFFKSNCKLF